MLQSTIISFSSANWRFIFSLLGLMVGKIHLRRWFYYSPIKTTLKIKIFMQKSIFVCVGLCAGSLRGPPIKVNFCRQVSQHKRLCTVFQ